MTQKRVGSLFYQILIIAFGIMLLYPLIWMIGASFMSDSEIFQSGMRIIPETIMLENYSIGWAGLGGVSFATFFRNSFIISGVNVVGNVLSCSLAAYAFAKTNFRFKRFWFAVMLGTMMLPIHVTLIPTYIIFHRLDWINTFLPLTIPSFFAMNGFFIFMMTQFMRNIPKEIDQAALIDGAGAFKHYTHIILPISLPAIVTTAIFAFIWSWNDFFTQMIYLTDTRLFTVSLALRQFVDATGQSSWGALFAMSALSLIPLFLIFVFLQKYLVEGITAGSIKG